jgi:hypothetical protein
MTAFTIVVRFAPFPDRRSKAPSTITAVPPLRTASAVVVALACLLAVGCGGSNRAATSTTLPAASTPNADCPFSGATTPSQGPGTGSGAVIASLTPSVAGCIDNVTVDFKTPPPAWSVAYSNGPFVDSKTGASVTVPGPANLVVTLSGTTYPGIPGGTTPATIPPAKNNYVTGISIITGANGALEFIISLPQQLQYVTSQSNTPSNFVLSIG